MPGKRAKVDTPFIEAAKLRPVFTPETRQGYVNHAIVGSTGMELSIAFGHLSPYAGFNGLQPARGTEQGTFDVNFVLTAPNVFTARLAEALLRQLALSGFAIEEIVKTVREQTPPPPK